jgi:hypothetical protein
VTSMRFPPMIGRIYHPLFNNSTEPAATDEQCHLAPDPVKDK